MQWHRIWGARGRALRREVAVALCLLTGATDPDRPQFGQQQQRGGKPMGRSAANAGRAIRGGGDYMWGMNTAAQQLVAAAEALGDVTPKVRLAVQSIYFAHSAAKIYPNLLGYYEYPGILV